MRGLFFVLVITIPLNLFGEPLPLIPLPPPLLNEAALAELPALYEEVLRAGLGNNVGHTISASMIASCLPPARPGKKLDALVAMVTALSKSRIREVQKKFIRGIECDATVTILAATLICKMGERSSNDMVALLEKAYIELLRLRMPSGGMFVDAFRNVQAAAHLIH